MFINYYNKKEILLLLPFYGNLKALGKLKKAAKIKALEVNHFGSSILGQDVVGLEVVNSILIKNHIFTINSHPML